MKTFIRLQYALIILLFLATIQVGAQEKNNFELSKNLEIYADLLRQLNLNYADDIKPGELNTTAINAMLEKLDPYTVYVPESKREDFELMTKGEYGGIGALIQQQGDYVIITEPYEEFPAQKAGLKAGDQIMSIDGESAKGKTTTEVSDKLKGVPGSEFNLLIKRYGDSLTSEVTIVREKIKIPNIPYSGFISQGIGYISLSQFNPNSAQEVRNAFSQLATDQPLKGLIIDLRGNGGGLLNEAVDIVNIFVPKNELVVTTKGKTKASIQTHVTRNKEIDGSLPLVIMVNNNSASASEIVAGAIQDLDRGVIIGERTYGKGLVQNIVPLPYNSKVKIT
ncbi:MAG: peptidase S41, partial [Bacteroidetes bacterium CG_4_10_14_3_um_filter_42_6]